MLVSPASDDTSRGNSTVSRPLASVHRKDTDSGSASTWQRKVAGCSRDTTTVNGFERRHTGASVNPCVSDRPFNRSFVGSEERRVIQQSGNNKEVKTSEEFCYWPRLGASASIAAYIAIFVFVLLFLLRSLSSFIWSFKKKQLLFLFPRISTCIYIYKQYMHIYTYIHVNACVLSLSFTFNAPFNFCHLTKRKRKDSGKKNNFEKEKTFQLFCKHTNVEKCRS